MGTLSVGRLRLHPASLLVLVILMGIPLVSSSLGAEYERNTASKNRWRRQAPLPVNDEAAHRNIWRRQYPLPANEEESASLHIYRRQSDDDAAAASPPDDASEATSDPSNANPAENEINVGGNAVGRQAGVQGYCRICIKHQSSTTGPCLDAPDVTMNSVPSQCPLNPDNFVYCLTYIMKMRGTRLAEKSKLNNADKEKRRIDGRTCPHGSGPQKTGAWLMDCALEILDMKLEDGKCVKGTYPISLIEKVSMCMNDYNYPTGPNPFPFDDLKDDKSTAPEPGKSPSTADHGLFWGEYGRVQYADVTFCLCKQKPIDPMDPSTRNSCNDKLAKDLLKNTVEVATDARKLSTGILRWLPM